LPIGLGVGLAAGFFGIGGGFLIVPGLIIATAMPLPFAIDAERIVGLQLGTRQLRAAYRPIGARLYGNEAVILTALRTDSRPVS
jgi:hypothetical protein